MQASKKAYATIAGGVSAFTAYKAFTEYRKSAQASLKFTQVDSELAEFKPIELRGEDAAVYPWYRNNNINDWEFKLVKLRGYFKEERFFVRREREGKPGYIVLAPFITSYTTLAKSFKTGEANPPLESGLMVSMGWVPAENKDDIEMNGEPLPLIDGPEAHEYPERDPHTGFTNNPDNIIEDEVFPLTEVVGIVRRGEEKDLLNRRVNFPKDAVFQYIDLPWLSRFFRFFNVDSAGSAYIERMVPQYDEESENLFPLPATKETYFKPLANPTAYSKVATFYTGASLVSLLSIFLYALK